MEMNKFYNCDCMEYMATVPDKYFDLIVIDPPYNINKAKWDKINNYIEWMGTIFLECQRTLKDNGSFYWFHNDMMQIKDLMTWIEKNTRFIFKQFIIWNKRFEGAKNKGFLDGFVETNQLRNYQKMAEYCLFYTFQDETGLTTIMLDTNNFSTLRKYFKEYQEALGLTKKEIIKIAGQQADHCFRWGSSQWDLPTEETYSELNKIPLKNNFLRREYEDLRQEYENLRYTFNNQKTHHSVWDYEISPKLNHITPKPVDLIENIILHSSNKNDIIFDAFAGSGTTAIACINTNRNYICCELDKDYYEAANKRIEEYKLQGKLF